MLLGNIGCPILLEQHWGANKLKQTINHVKSCQNFAIFVTYAYVTILITHNSQKIVFNE
jgi:hypothetical protein